MCTPKRPKAPPPDAKPRPLRILLSRDRYDKRTVTSGGPPGNNYTLPKRDTVASTGGINISAGLNVPV